MADKPLSSSLLRAWIVSELRFLSEPSNDKYIETDAKLVLQKLLSAMHSGDLDAQQCLDAHRRARRVE